MSAIQPQTMPRQRVTGRTRVAGIILTLVLAALAFVFSPHMPLGRFWAPAAGLPQPAGIQIFLLVLLNIFEVLAFGLGVSFLVFGWSYVRAISPASRGLTIASFVSTAWLLANWWPHDSLHLHIGETSLSNLLLVEYGFHVTLMIAGVILMAFFISILRHRSMPER
jgi:hypothetical protein